MTEITDEADRKAQRLQAMCVHDVQTTVKLFEGPNLVDQEVSCWGKQEYCPKCHNVLSWKRLEEVA